MSETTSRRPNVVNRRAGFTLIELLTVIAILCMVAGLAIPGFVSMQKEQVWRKAIGNLEIMIMRARSKATNSRNDMSVEFQYRAEDHEFGEGVELVLESEDNLIEHLTKLETLQQYVGGTSAIYWLLSREWRWSGGVSDPVTIDGREYRRNCELIPENSQAVNYGDNAFFDSVDLGEGMTIDNSETASPGLINWDAKESVVEYGYDETLDIRISPSGALVQTIEPVICFKKLDESDEARQVRVIRCTGRVLRVR